MVGDTSIDDEAAPWTRPVFTSSLFVGHARRVLPHVMDQTLGITLAPETSSVPEARRFLRSSLDSICCVKAVDDRTAGDLELAVSELITNAVEHGGSSPIDLLIEIGEGCVSLAVTSRGSATSVGPGSEWKVADVTSITGRGLGIVRALVDRIDVQWRGDAVTIRVERDLAA